MIVNNEDLIHTLSSFKVAILPTNHFTEALEKRMFPLNVIAHAIVLAQSIPIGQNIEIYSSNKFRATVELKKVSTNVALLITGWKGVRNSSLTKGSNNENHSKNSLSINIHSNIRMCR